jgi:hypothetical protein
MRVDVLSVRVAYFSEAVHVELAYEGAKVAVFEVAWEDFFGEEGDVFDVERVASGGPADGGLDLSILYRMGATSTIYSSFVMNRDVCAPRPFRPLIQLIIYAEQQ